MECAINNSKSDSTIYLNDGEYVGDNNRNIAIDKSITIIGKSKQSTIINGESCGRLFNVTPNSKLTLINLTLVNGYSAENGGPGEGPRNPGKSAGSVSPLKIRKSGFRCIIRNTFPSAGAARGACRVR